MIVIIVADFGDSIISKIYHDDTQYAVTSTVHLYLESSMPHGMLSITRIELVSNQGFMLYNKQQRIEAEQKVEY